MKTFRHNILTTVIIVGTSLLTLCCHSELDRRSLDSVGEYLLDAIAEYDTTKIKDILSYSDYWQKFGPSDYFYNPLDNVKNAHGFLGGRDYQIISCDTILEVTGDFYNGSYRTYRKQYLNLNIKENEKFHRVGMRYERDSIKNIIIHNIYYRNLTEECQNETEKLFTPFGYVEFVKITWQPDYSLKTFKEFKVWIKNTSPGEITSLTFKVVLKDLKNREFFNQTITYNTIIPKGDLIAIDVPSAKNYYAGGVTIARNNIEYYPELLGLLPKPLPSCKIIEEIKSAYEAKQ